MIPRGNSKGDVYQNVAEARMGGLALPIGPVFTPVHVVASSIGNFVFIDKNGNG
jgi:hypothetical protein